MTKSHHLAYISHTSIIYAFLIVFEFHQDINGSVQIISYTVIHHVNALHFKGKCFLISFGTMLPIYKFCEMFVEVTHYISTLAHVHTSLLKGLQSMNDVVYTMDCLHNEIAGLTIYLKQFHIITYSDSIF